MVCHRWDIMQMVSSTLVGLVAITAPCGLVHPGFSIVIGVAAFFVHKLFRRLAIALWIDDPVDAFAVHFGGAVVGTLAVGLFADDSIISAYYENKYQSDCGGLLYVGNPYLLLMQLLGFVSIMAWTIFWALPFFLIMKRLGKLRIRFQDETIGIDIAKTHGTAYPYFEIPV
eukprot:TRINITY_DN1642_c0_g1_i1.p1 TRINITY_DN1642_c0_g1~~TRINITY_DN1642_c0_g1_i1.p1  ORF type:complete len:171 (-),score=49.19 TRINITY_DN1642_c0_g1_i1:403-915(-)